MISDEQVILGLRWFRRNTDITASVRDHGILRATGLIQSAVPVQAREYPPEPFVVGVQAHESIRHGLIRILVR